MRVSVEAEFKRFTQRRRRKGGGKSEKVRGVHLRGEEDAPFDPALRDVRMNRAVAQFRENLEKSRARSRFAGPGTTDSKPRSSARSRRDTGVTNSKANSKAPAEGGRYNCNI